MSSLEFGVSLLQINLDLGPDDGEAIPPPFVFIPEEKLREAVPGRVSTVASPRIGSIKIIKK